MQIRFLQTCASEHPEYPFMAGQVINVTAPSRLLLSHLSSGCAEAVKSELERAVADEDERPEPQKRGRKRVAR